MITIHEPKPMGVKRSSAEAWAEMWIMINTETLTGDGVWIIFGLEAFRVGAVTRTPFL